MIAAGDLCLTRYALRLCRVQSRVPGDGVRRWYVEMREGPAAELERNLIVLAPAATVWNDAELTVAKWVAAKLNR